MTTSALRLQQFLFLVSKHKSKGNFLDTAVDFLGLNGPLSHGEAAAQIQRLSVQVKQDLMRLQKSNTEIDNAHASLAPFKGLMDLSLVYLSMDQAKQHYLAPSKLMELTVIHSLLSGKIERLQDLSEAEDLSALTENLINEFESQNYPDDFSLVVKKRLLQVKIGLDTFRHLGAENLSFAVENLIGSIVVRSQELSKEQKDGLKPVSEVASKVLEAIDKSAKASKNADTLIERIPKISEFIGNLVGNSGSS